MYSTYNFSKILNNFEYLYTKLLELCKALLTCSFQDLLLNTHYTWFAHLKTFLFHNYFYDKNAILG